MARREEERARKREEKGRITFCKRWERIRLPACHRPSLHNPQSAPFLLAWRAHTLTNPNPPPPLPQQPLQIAHLILQRLLETHHVQPLPHDLVSDLPPPVGPGTLAPLCAARGRAGVGRWSCSWGERDGVGVLAVVPEVEAADSKGGCGTGVGRGGEVGELEEEDPGEGEGEVEQPAWGQEGGLRCR